MPCGGVVKSALWNQPCSPRSRLDPLYLPQHSTRGQLGIVKRPTLLKLAGPILYENEKSDACWLVLSIDRREVPDQRPIGAPRPKSEYDNVKEKMSMLSAVLSIIRYQWCWSSQSCSARRRPLNESHQHSSQLLITNITGASVPKS